MENEHLDVISGCIERANSLGDSMDCLTFHMFDIKQDLHYIKEETFKNPKPASSAIYEISPHGRFAYFAANSTILDCMPE
ncbi:hypothetical protein NL676_003134 [Syzygium grande]|nr:hypothetical protein NL676_003134 [Syzygium grande]